MNAHTLSLRDGSTLQLNIFLAGASSPLLLFLPAMGVRASYYVPFATALQQAGISVITADLRGTGSSSVRASRKLNYGYQEMIEDIGELREWIQGQYPDHPFLLGGHSLGGQLSSLFAARYPQRLEGLILVSSCLVYLGAGRAWLQPGCGLRDDFFPLSAASSVIFRGISSDLGDGRPDE